MRPNLHRTQHDAQGTEHPPHLHHHFETVQQQYASDKLAMWLFLTTEILLFGGLFCVYAVYRANHPEIFIYADRYLDRTLGGINTVVLILSSFTMAWAVRAAQLGQRRLLIGLLSFTILCGFGFLGIKGVEYERKWKEGLLWGAHYGQKEASLEQLTTGIKKAGAEPQPGQAKAGRPESGAPVAEAESASPGKPAAKAPEQAAAPAKPAVQSPAAEQAKPAAGKPAATPAQDTAPAKSTPAAAKAPAAAAPVNPDAPLIKPAARGPAGLARLPGAPGAQVEAAPEAEPKNVQMFFAVYFTMTGLHAMHVIAGMTVIFIMILLAARGKFDDGYFTPVDLTGLFWHLVDIVWIFLFPLLYLIH